MRDIETLCRVDQVEQVKWNRQVLAYIIRANVLPEETSFMTPSDSDFQVGFVVHGEGECVPRHVHPRRVRHVESTSELLVVRKGCCGMDIYNDDRKLVAKRELNEGDIVLLVAGGHGFHMMEDTVLLEVKQGPYGGENDKVRF